MDEARHRPIWKGGALQDWLEGQGSERNRRQGVARQDWSGTAGKAWSSVEDQVRLVRPGVAKRSEVRRGRLGVVGLSQRPQGTAGMD